VDLTELVDRALITDTLHAYCDLVDRSDVEGLLALFTDDLVMDMGRGVVVHGRERFRALLLDRIGRWTTTSHHCSTVVLTRWDGGTAATTSHLYAFHDAPARDETMHMWGRYTDELVKQGDRWLIRERRLRVAGVQLTPSSPLPDRFEPFPRTPLPSP